jgi:hypothetical protein
MSNTTESIIFIILLFGIPSLIYYIIQKKDQEKWNAISEKHVGIKNKSSEIRKCFHDLKKKKIQHALSLIDVNTSEIVNQQTIQWPKPYFGSWEAVDRDDGIISGYQHVCLIPSGFIVLTCPSYRIYNHRPGFLYDGSLNVNYCKEAIGNLEIKTIKLLFDDVADITYADEKITLSAGKSDSYGEISGTTTESSMSVDGGALGGSIGSGTFDGSISMAGSQGGVIKDLTAESTIKLLAENGVELLEIKLAPIDVNNEHVLRELQRIPFSFLEDAAEDEAEIKKLKGLYQLMKAHLQKKKSYENTLKEVSNKDRFASSDLSDDAYKIFLTKEFNIEKNDVLQSFVVTEKLFDTIEDALVYADGLYRNRHIKN